MRNKERVNEIFDELANKFEARDQLYRLLERHYEKYGHVPKEFLPAWNTYQSDKRPWREVKGLEKKLRRTARRTEQNERLDGENRRNRRADRYVDKHMKRIK